MRRSNFALRLQPSLMQQARKAAEAEGVALNQLINVAIAEKVSALRTIDFFRNVASRGNPKEALRVLERLGVGNAPMPGDEMRGNKAKRKRKPMRPTRQKRQRHSLL
jgi:hypothetical protein